MPKKIAVGGFGWGVGGAADVNLKLARITNPESLVAGTLYQVPV